MILLAHIIIALSSLFVTAYAFITPTRTSLKVSYVLVGLTIATGTYIAVANPAHMVQACVSGLIYTGFVMAGIIAVRRKLALSRG